MQLSAERKPAADPSSPEAVAAQLATFLRHLTTACDGPFLEAVSQQDLTLGQLKTMSLLAHAAHRLSVKDVAQQLGISLPSASRAIDPLVRRRLVARQEDAEDRRVKRLELTAKGDALVERLTAARVSSFERMLEELTESERRKLASALESILARQQAPAA